MDYSTRLDVGIDGNLNTGNISTDDFLAIFSSTSPASDVAGAGWGGGSGGGGGGRAGLPGNATHSLAGGSVTLNPPLLTVDGQYTLANVLEASLAGIASSTISTPLTSPATINESFFLLSTNFYNTSGNGTSSGSGPGSGSINLTAAFGNSYNQTLANGVGAIGDSDSAGNISEVHWDGRYPSGYTLTHIVIASIVVTILMIIIIVGNMLVIIAIATEKSLKNIQNWFIASLAVADFFLGLVIMPFSLANELMGYWIFGSWWCDIHSAMDVLLCTASIMNLCLISLDRYWSITKAVDYLKSRTPARAALMIAAVWIMSALICIPPLLGWKVKMPEGPLPKCALSEDIGYVLYSALGSFYIPSCIMVFVYIRIYFAAKARARRGIKKHPRKANNEQVTSFTTATGKKGTIPMPSSGASGALHMRLQRQIATIETPPNSAAGAPPIQIPTVTCDLASDISTSEAGEMEQPPSPTPSPSPSPAPPPPPEPAPASVLLCSNSRSSPALANSGLVVGTGLPPEARETLKVSTITSSHGALNVPVPPSMAANATVVASSTVLNNNNTSATTAATMTATATVTVTAATASTNLVVPKCATTTATSTTSSVSNVSPNELRVSPMAARCRALSVGIDTDLVSEFDPSSSDSGVVSRCAVVKPLKFRLCQPIFGRRSDNHRRRNEAKAAVLVATKESKPADELVKAELEPALPKVQKTRDPEKEKRRIARKKEKRATLILGLIMGSFIACWLPFFFLYILMPACRSHCHIPDSAFAIAFWLGYMNSALNPAIYTIFNKDFRRAFRRILFK